MLVSPSCPQQQQLRLMGNVETADPSDASCSSSSSVFSLTKRTTLSNVVRPAAAYYSSPTLNPLQSRRGAAVTPNARQRPPAFTAPSRRWKAVKRSFLMSAVKEENDHIAGSIKVPLKEPYTFISFTAAVFLHIWPPSWSKKNAGVNGWRRESQRRTWLIAAITPADTNYQEL